MGWLGHPGETGNVLGLNQDVTQSRKQRIFLKVDHYFLSLALVKNSITCHNSLNPSFAVKIGKQQDEVKKNVYRNILLAKLQEMHSN